MFRRPDAGAAPIYRGEEARAAHGHRANAVAGALVLVGKRGTPMFSEYAARPGGGRPTWDAADIARFTREAGGDFLGLEPPGWGGWPR